MIRVELYRQIRRLRTWLAFGALAALPVIVAVAQRLDREDRRREGAEQAVYAFGTASGLNHAIAALTFMSPFFLVIVVSMLGGESVAGEASWGTLRSLLVRPVRRARLLRAKLGVAGALALCATLVIVIAGTAAGTVAFGWHAVEMPLQAPIAPAEGAMRLALAAVYVWWVLAAVVAFAFFVSTLTDTPSGAIASAVGLAIASQILDGIRAFRAIQPGLPTHYLSAWASLFGPFGSTSDMARGVLVSLAWVGIFASLAFWRFSRKDILS